MGRDSQQSGFSVDENIALMLLGFGGLAHALVWIALRDPSDVKDAFVGAEGLIVFSLLFIAIGAIRRRSSR